MAFRILFASACRCWIFYAPLSSTVCPMAGVDAPGFQSSPTPVCVSLANGRVFVLLVVVYSHVMLVPVARAISAFASLSLSKVGRHSAIWLSHFVRRAGWYPITVFPLPYIPIPTHLHFVHPLPRGPRVPAIPLTSSQAPTEASPPSSPAPPCRETSGARERPAGEQGERPDAAL